LSLVGIDSVIEFISLSTEIGIKFNETKNATCYYGIFIGLIGFFIPDDYFAILLRVRYDPSSDGKYQKTKDDGLVGIILSRLTALFLAVVGGGFYVFLTFMIFNTPFGILFFGGMGYIIIFGVLFVPDVRICCLYQNLGGSKKVHHKTDDKGGSVSDYGDKSSDGGCGGCGGD